MSFKIYKYTNLASISVHCYLSLLSMIIYKLRNFYSIANTLLSFFLKTDFLGLVFGQYLNFSPILTSSGLWKGYYQPYTQWGAYLFMLWFYNPLSFKWIKNPNKCLTNRLKLYLRDSENHISWCSSFPEATTQIRSWRFWSSNKISCHWKRNLKDNCQFIKQLCKMYLQWNFLKFSRVMWF